MPKITDDVIYIGINGSVLALDRSTGTRRWQTPLKGSGFVNMVRDKNLLLATTRGLAFCLDPVTGKILWTNGLEGCGYGIATILAGDSSQNVAAMAEQEAQDQQQSDIATAAPPTM